MEGVVVATIILAVVVVVMTVAFWKFARYQEPETPDTRQDYLYIVTNTSEGKVGIGKHERVQHWQGRGYKIRHLYTGTRENVTSAESIILEHLNDQEIPYAREHGDGYTETWPVQFTRQVEEATMKVIKGIELKKEQA